jgi:hypothetical protein
LKKTDLQKHLLQAKALAKVEAEQKAVEKAHRKIAIVIETPELNTHLKELQEQHLINASFIDKHWNLNDDEATISYTPGAEEEHTWSFTGEEKEQLKEKKNITSLTKKAETNNTKECMKADKLKEDQRKCELKKADTTCPAAPVRKLKTIRI